MFLAALCSAVVPAGHSYFPLVVLAEEGNRNNLLLGPGDSPCVLNTLFSPCRGGAIAVTRVQVTWSGWPWAGVMWPLRIQFQLAAKD